MKTYLARYWAVYGISVVAPALAGCGDSTGTPDGSTTEATQGSTTEDPTTVAATDTGTSSTTDQVPTSTSGMTGTGTATETTGPEPTGTSTGTTESTGPVSASSTADTSGTTGELCMTILCGDPAVCCADTDECVGGECIPICPSGVRCGVDQEICCEGGDVCVGEACTTPGADCSDSYDCEVGEYCEPVLDKCLPQPADLACTNKPTFDKVDVQLEWSWTVNEVTVLPLIADITGDETPEVVVNTSRIDGLDRNLGEIVALNGKTGAELWRIKEDPANMSYGSFGLGTHVIGDVNGDKRPDIVYPGRATGAVLSKISPVIAVDGDGKLLWVGHNANNAPVKIRWEHGAAVMANLDDDPEAEIAVGGALFDNDGLMVWNQNNLAGVYGTPTNNQAAPNTKLIYTGGLATFADLTGDGKPELLTGREAWTINWAPGTPPVVSLTQLWKNTSGAGNDGWPAVGDLDGNGTPEVVLVAWPDIKVLDGLTGKLWCGVDPTGVMCNNNDALRTQPIPIKGGNLGGPATIADFDGDGKPEVGIAGGLAYAVYDFARKDEDIVDFDGGAAPVAGSMFIRWAKTTQDNSSACTGSSVFDFQGDGAAEVAYQDECKVYVYDGKTGTSQLEILNSSGTVHEYPLVVDADGDGNAEFLTVANLSETKQNDVCKGKIPGFVPRKGVFSYGAGADNWVPTRKVWTQHTYHVTNAESDGNVPLMEMSNWTDPNLNNFRQNVQGEGVFNAADLTASLAVSLDKCSKELVLQATVYNEGALGVPSGIDVTFYEGNDNTGLKLVTKPTIQPILTGGSTVVTWTVDAPEPGTKKSYYVEIDGGPNNSGIITECNETNNGALVTDAECPMPG